MSFPAHARPPRNPCPGNPNGCVQLNEGVDVYLYIYIYHIYTDIFTSTYIYICYLSIGIACVEDVMQASCWTFTAQPCMASCKAEGFGAVFSGSGALGAMIIGLIGAACLGDTIKHQNVVTYMHIHVYIYGCGSKPVLSRGSPLLLQTFVAGPLLQTLTSV